MPRAAARFASPPLLFAGPARLFQIRGRPILNPKTPHSFRPQTGPPASTALAVLFFFSGAIALVYEVVWHRQFALLLGSAAPATAAVLAAYFAGLGAGSYLLGRMAGRWTNPLRTYAILEVLIALGALGTVGLLPAMEWIYPRLYTSLTQAPAMFFAAKLGLAFLAIALPTFCMGGTLPVLGRFVDQHHQRLGVTAGLLYVTNTAGAGLGALSVPFLLLPWVGIHGTLALCLGGNLALATWAWRMSRHPSTGAAGNLPEKPKPLPAAPRTLAPGTVYGLAFVSGAVAFALQVFWNRAFAQVHENFVHSFALIVAVVILALALGGQLARVALRRGLTPCWIIAAGWGLAGLGVVIGPWLFVWLTDGLAYLPTNNSWLGSAGRLLGLTALVVLPPMTLLGIGLPALLDEAGRGSRQDVSVLIGRVLAINIAGAVTGALLAGFILPRWLGMWSALVLIGVLLVLAGIYLLGRQQTKRSRPGWASKLVLLTELALLLVITLMAMSVAQVNLPRVLVASGQGEKLVFLAEGTHGITAVTERPGSRRLKLNNHYLLGGTASTGDERMQTHLPLLLHPAPRNIAFLGLGTGITAGGIQFHPFDRATLVELVPEVVTAARAHFADANAGVLTDPRVTVKVDDARNFLRGSRERFDVIIGDLVVPWRQGEGALFTVESFTAARNSLAEGGLYCQWVPCFQLSAPELQIILRTFLEVFPDAQIWRGDFSPKESALALIGGRNGTHLEPGVVRERLAAMKSDPANTHLARPAMIWMHYLGALEARQFSGSRVALNTDAHPVIELLGPLRRDSNRPFLTGRRLQQALAELLPQGNHIPAGLDPHEQSGLRAGRLFEELLLLVAEGNGPRARELQQELRATLPEDHYRLLFP